MLIEKILQELVDFVLVLCPDVREEKVNEATAIDATVSTVAGFFSLSQNHCTLLLFIAEV